MVLKGNNIGILEEINLELANLTVISGVNGFGKSTICKILYLLQKGFYKNR